MRIASGVIDQYLTFVAKDPTDFETRETGLTSFTIYRSRNGGTPVVMDTPTIVELSAANMAGVYALLADEDMVIDAGNDTEEMTFHITHGSMHPATVTLELYRPKITAGTTLDSAQLVDDIWDEVITGVAHNINNSSGKILRQIRGIGVYQNGGLWYDTTGRGSAGAVTFENGTVDNPVDNEADLRTLIAATGYNTVFVSPGSSITLAGTYTNTAFFGKNWTLALGNQVATGLVAFGASITGVCSSGSLVRIEDCNIGAATIPAGKFVNCGIGRAGGTFTAAAAGEFIFDQCYSEAPGQAIPSLVFTGLGIATNINNRGWLGGSNYTLDSDCALSHEVLAGGITTVATGGAEVEIRGITSAVTLTLGTGTSETVQFVGMTGPITISGSPTAAIVNLYGISASATQTLSGATITDDTVTADIKAVVANKIADHVRRRSNANTEASADGDAVSFRSSLGADAKLTNKISIAGSTLTITKSDDATPLGTQTLTSDASAEPIIGADTV